MILCVRLYTEAYYLAWTEHDANDGLGMKYTSHQWLEVQKSEQAQMSEIILPAIY